MRAPTMAGAARPWDGWDLVAELPCGNCDMATVLLLGWQDCRRSLGNY